MISFQVIWTSVAFVIILGGLSETSTLQEYILKRHVEPRINAKLTKHENITAFKNIKRKFQPTNKFNSLGHWKNKTDGTNHHESKEKNKYIENKPLSQKETIDIWAKKRIKDKIDKLTTTTPKVTTLKRKSSIRKIVTKWMDEGDLNSIFKSTNKSYDSSEPIQFSNVAHQIKLSLDSDENSNNTDIKPTNKLSITAQSSEDGTQVFSTQIQVLDLDAPAPKPIVTYAGAPRPNLPNDHKVYYPKPPIIQKWPEYNNHYESTNAINVSEEWKPVETSYEDSDEFDHATEQTFASYSDRIVIRPQEELGLSDNCPTIYLTLNNTVKAQGKEACPDLNIAVNTNVLNKNVVIQDSKDEELEDDSGGGQLFGAPILPLDSGSTENFNQYYDALGGGGGDSVEGSLESLSSLGDKEAETLEAGSSGSYSGAPANPSDFDIQPPRPSRPNRPNKHKDKDEQEDQDSLSDWLTPATTIMSWLSALNPLHLGAFSIMLAPLALLLAGSSGVAALVAPWAIPYARQAPKIVHVYRPAWKWDPHQHSWNWHSYPHNRRWPTNPRSSEELDSTQSTSSLNYVTENVKNFFISKLKEPWKMLKEAYSNYNDAISKKHVRKNRSLKKFKYR